MVQRGEEADVVVGDAGDHRVHRLAIAPTIPASMPVTTVRTRSAGVLSFWLKVFRFAVASGFMVAFSRCRDGQVAVAPGAAAAAPPFHCGLPGRRQGITTSPRGRLAGLVVTVQQRLPEVGQTLHGVLVDRGAAPGQGRLDLAVGTGLQAAAAAALEVLLDPAPLRLVLPSR